MFSIPISHWCIRMESKNDTLLLCDEDLFLSSTPSPRNHTSNFSRDEPNSSYFFFDDIKERDRVVHSYLSREGNYKPMNGYLEKLSFYSELCSARFKAVRWIILARDRLGLEYGTIFAAINYLDRFISMNSHINKWEVWMMELISIACLSIASKVDEVLIPSLHDLQSEDLEHKYNPSTIERMELSILKALDWRLVCITPYSYIDLIICQVTSFHASLRILTIELLLKTLLESKLVHCSASAIAVSALQFSIKELVPFECDAYLSILRPLIPAERKVEMENCRKLMEEKIIDPHCCPTSPNTVIPAQRTLIVHMHVDIDTCFLRMKEFNQDFSSKKRKCEGFGVEAGHSND